MLRKDFAPALRILSGLVAMAIAVMAAAPTRAQQPAEPAPARLLWQSESPPFSHREPGGRVEFSPDGKILATNDNPIGAESFLFWDAATGRLLRRLKPVIDGVGGTTTFAFSPDGKLFVGCWGARGHATLWDLETGQARFSLKLHEETIFNLKFLPDGSHFVTAGFDGKIRVTRVADQAIVSTWNVQTNGQSVRDQDVFSPGESLAISVQSLDIAGDGQRIVTAVHSSGVTEAVVWRIGSEEPVMRMQRPNDQGQASGRRIHTARFSRDGTKVITGGTRLVPRGADRQPHEPLNFQVTTIIVWDANTGEATTEYSANGVYGFGAFELSPDGGTVATSDFDGIHLWRLGENKPYLRLTLPGWRGTVKSSFSPDGKQIAAMAGGGVKIWDTNTGELVVGEAQSLAPVSIVAWSADGSMLGVGRRGLVEVWNVAQRSRQMTASMGEPVEPSKRPPEVAGLSFSANGAGLIAAGERNDPERLSDASAIRVWDVANGELRLEVKSDRRFDNDARCLAFAPDGRQVVIQTADISTLYELPQHAPIAEVSASAMAMCFTPDGRFIWIAGLDGKVFRWDPTRDVREAEYTAEWRNADELIDGRDMLRIFSGVFSPDGRTLVASHQMTNRRNLEGALVFWDNELGQVKHILRNQPTFRLAISPDGRLLAGFEEISYRHKPTDAIHIWDVASGRELFTLLPQDARATAMAFSPDGKQLLTGFDRGTIAIWDVRP